MTEIQHQYIHANGIRFHYVTAGKGPILLLLHGFPETWYAWRHQIPVLAEHFQVVAPDLRGYGETDKPPHIADYKPDILAQDIAALIHTLGHAKAHIVGHDWGGGIAWRVAMNHPEVVDHLVVLNCPHPKIMAKALRSNWAQMRRSWYIFFFQLPWLPERFLSRNLKTTLKGILRGSANRPKILTNEDIGTYLASLQQPGALTAALNYYRAAFRYPSHGFTPIKAPTLLIWGENDQALGKELTYGMDSLFSGPFKIAYIPQCSHWVNEEQPEITSRLIVDHLKNRTT